MHKYLHHIGDFMRDTVHLNTLEECFYRRALDFYYLNEKPLPKETQVVFRRLRANNPEEQQAVINILNDFFTEQEDGFHNKRCDAEIDEYVKNVQKNRENGKKGGRPPKKQAQNKPNDNPEKTHSVSLGYENATQNNLNHKPLTINQEPITSNQYKYVFDLDYVNANLLKSGTQMVDQKFVDELQPQFELYYADQPMTENKALVKFVQWIMRNKNGSNVGKNTYQTSQQKTEAEMDKWRNFAQSENSSNEPIDITPEQQIFIEG